jgi:hypothetical protein
MRQRGYAIAFALVLVAIVAGAYFGGRFVVQRFRQDFQFRRAWSPPELATPLPATAAPEVTPLAQAAAPTRRPAPTQVVVPTPVAPTPEPFTSPAPSASAPAGATARASSKSQEATRPVVASTPPLTAAAAEPFAAKGPVRASLGDCGGTYVLGRVTGRDGQPVPGVRLRLVDEFENEAFAVTKSGQADLGRYDFPVAGPPRRFSLSVVDEAGSALSRTAGFAYYGNAADAQATCYWIDWQRR